MVLATRNYTRQESQVRCDGFEGRLISPFDLLPCFNLPTPIADDAFDLPRLNALHGSLRQRLLESPLCDGPAFIRKYEYALRGMWCNWCSTQGARLTPAQASMAAFDFSALAAQAASQDGPGKG